MSAAADVTRVHVLGAGRMGQESRSCLPLPEST